MVSKKNISFGFIRNSNFEPASAKPMFLLYFLPDLLLPVIDKSDASVSCCDLKHSDSREQLTMKVPCNREKSLQKRTAISKHHECTLCEKAFRSPSSLRSHQKKRHNMDLTQTAENDLACGHCGKRYAQPLSLRKHEELHRNEANYNPECSPRPPVVQIQKLAPLKRKDLPLPMLPSSDGTYFQHAKNYAHTCTLCGKLFWYMSTLRRHQKKVHNLDLTSTDDLVCRKCNKQCKTAHLLLRHEKVHRNEAQAQAERQCTVCGRLMSDKRALERHMLTHTGERAFMCSTCGRMCPSRSELLAHERTHTGEKRHACSKCDRRFGQIGQLRYHEINYHCENPTMYVCNLCGHQFKHQQLLKHHMQMHTGEKPHRCERCDKSFRSRTKLAEHARLHTGEKPYSCTVCVKKFRIYSTYHRHQLLHRGQRPYRCPMCDKSFTQACNMHTHMRTHTGEKPFVCKVCDQKFSHSGTLQKHILTHVIKSNVESINYKKIETEYSKCG